MVYLPPIVTGLKKRAVHTFYFRVVAVITCCSVFAGSPDIAAALRPEAQSS